ncbi:ATP-binding protein [Roseateles sp. LKC17W]|uniref:ATP-binding protein n=1 Tax=Pelomonas margarita TaxID=3299031 RepID=A0ABW7FPI3_9BURK
MLAHPVRWLCPVNPSSVLHFDRYELQIDERRLLCDCEPVPLGARAFDLLVALTARAGQLVTKDELLDAVWPGLVVGENNIAAQVVALRRALHSELIVTVPGRGYRFTGRPRTGGAASANLPAPTASQASPMTARTAPRLFGREADLQRLKSMLQLPGCVTLIGPGGVGKTVLAMCAVHDQAVHWIDLAPLVDGSQVLAAVQRAVGQPDADPPAVAGAAPLVVLDNAEHVIDAVAALVPRLLAATPALRLLVTSQAPLTISGERVDRLEPLALPAPDLPDAEALATAAPALFIERARAANSRWQLAADGAPQLRALCAELDGLPLALEMAAARVPALGLAGVRLAIAERFSLLRKTERDAPARQRTLLATLQWSHALLDPHEQRLLRTLGVFAGGFTLDLAATVATPDGSDRWDTIDRLAVLVDRSLVALDGQDPPRYRLLDTTRQFALDRLAETGEAAAVHQRHALALDELFAAAVPTSTHRPDPAKRALAQAELDNVRAAARWAVAHDAACALRLSAAASASFDYTWRADTLELLAACEPLVDQVPDLRLRARWWTEFAQQSLFANSSRAPEVAQRAVAASRAANDDWMLLWSLIALVRGSRSPDAQSAAALHEMQALLETNPGWRVQARIVALGTLAFACQVAGDLPAALAHREAELALAERAGITGHIGVAVDNLATVLRMLGRYDEALRRLESWLAQESEQGSFSAIYARGSVLRVMVEQGRLRDVFMRLPALLNDAQRIGLTVSADLAAWVLARAGRHRDCACFVGHLLQRRSKQPLRVADTGDDLALAESLARAALGDADYYALAAQGGRLDERNALALLDLQSQAG